MALTPRKLFSGSSPLARGLPDGVPTVEEYSGIIPARAGFTESQRTKVPKLGDHPRLRGVYRM